MVKGVMCVDSTKSWKHIWGSGCEKLFWLWWKYAEPRHTLYMEVWDQTIQSHVQKCKQQPEEAEWNLSIYNKVRRSGLPATKFWTKIFWHMVGRDAAHITGVLGISTTLISWNPALNTIITSLLKREMSIKEDEA